MRKQTSKYIVLYFITTYNDFDYVYLIIFLIGFNPPYFFNLRSTFNRFLFTPIYFLGYLMRNQPVLFKFQALSLRLFANAIETSSVMTFCGSLLWVDLMQIAIR